MSDTGNRNQRPNGNDRPNHGGGRDGARRDGAPRGGSARDSGARDSGARDSGGRDGARRESAPRDGAPRGNPGGHSSRARDAGGDKRLWTQGGAPARGNRDASERELPEDRDPFNIRSVRAHHEAPEIPNDVKPDDLDRIARNELKTLDKENAEGVARHLVMAARLIDTDPQLAHSHAISAARRAGRIGVVRETLAITAYAIEDYALALRELRTYRRITGRDDQLPMMVDSERGIGRPEKALELGRSVPRASLPVPVQVELAIAMSGARLDLNQAESALVELQIPQLDPATAFSWSPALFSAYATVLEELGRDAEAEEWYTRADIAADAVDAAGALPGDDTIEVIEEDDNSFFDSAELAGDDDASDDDASKGAL